MSSYKWILLLLVFFYSIQIQAQERTLDIQAIAEKDFSSEEITYYKKPKKNNTHTFHYPNKQLLIANNPVNLFFKGLMFLYQNALSPQISANCIYETTCSNFSKQSLHEFGLIKGVFLSADRLMRCNKSSEADASPYNYDLNSRKIIDEPLKYRVRKN